MKASSLCNGREFTRNDQRGNLALASSPVTTANDLAGISAAQASGRELIAQLQQVRATGRIVFSFKPDSRAIDSIPDVPLENGDTFLVPSVPSTVNAVGAREFGVNIIPHTLRHTTLGRLAPGDPVNLEVDLVARYLERLNRK